MRSHSRALGPALGALLALGPATAAEATERVLLLARPATGLGVRLRAELHSLGFETIELEPPPDMSPASLEGYARDHDALAAIHLSGDERAVEIWIADRTTDKTVLRRVPASGEGLADDTAVTKTVELLRASLLEIQVRPPAQEVSPSIAKLVGPASDAGEPGGGPAVTLRLGPAIAFGAGGLPPSARVDLDVVVALGELVSVGGSALIPTFPATLDEPEGDLSHSEAWLDARVELHPLAGGALDLRVGVALGAQIAYAQGDGAEGREGTSDVSASALGLAVVGAAFPLTRTFALDAEVSCGLTLPRTDYLVGAREVASVGWPLCAASVGVGLTIGAPPAGAGAGAK